MSEQPTNRAMSSSELVSHGWDIRLNPHVEGVFVSRDVLILGCLQLIRRAVSNVSLTCIEACGLLRDIANKPNAAPAWGGWGAVPPSLLAGHHTTSDGVEANYRGSSLSVRAKKVMMKLGANTAAELARRTVDEVLNQRNVGAATLMELREWLFSHGLDFADNHSGGDR